MGTSNFYSHAVLPVYAVMNDDILPYDQFCAWFETEEQFADDYEQFCVMNECGNTAAAEEFRMNRYYDELWFAWDIFNHDVLPDIQEELEQFNDELYAHSLSIHEGYYDGLQIKITDEWDRPETLDRETFEQFYAEDGDTLESYAAGFNAEEQKIKQFCDNLSEKYNMRKLVTAARFDNGETIYTEVK